MDLTWQLGLLEIPLLNVVMHIKIVDVKNVFYVFYYFYKNAFFNVFYFWNVFYFLIINAFFNGFYSWGQRFLHLCYKYSLQMYYKYSLQRKILKILSSKEDVINTLFSGSCSSY